MPEFNEKMEEIKNVDASAHEWMVREIPEVWARAYYNPRSKVNRMDNNMSEGFNTWIKEARDKPILTLVETIRRQLMVRYVDRLEYSKKFKGKLCPAIAKKVELNKVNARGLDVIYSGGTVFEVTTKDKTFVVDIGEYSCTCRKWDLSGIPCTHGCAAIIAHKAQPEDYVNDYYTSDTFVRTYSHSINPIPDKSLWPQTACEPIMPPRLRATTGRPKKARRKGEDEEQNPFKVRKHSTTTMCRQCGAFGHNRRTCKTAPECWVQHKGKYYGKQRAKYGGTVIAATGRGRGKGRGQQACKRLKVIEEGSFSSQQSRTGPPLSPSKAAASPVVRNGRRAKSCQASQASNDPQS